MGILRDTDKRKTLLNEPHLNQRSTTHLYKQLLESKLHKSINDFRTQKLRTEMTSMFY